MKTQNYDLTVTKFTYGGECLGRLPDGRAVFVPFTLPGEEIRVRLTEEKRSFARGELVEVLKPAAERISPRCPHFTLCGGCHYQHIPYEMQLAAKYDILADQLERIGKIENPPIGPAVASLQPFNYRNHIQFQISPEGRFGFFKPHTDQVLEIRECHLPLAPINTLWPQLDFESIPGLERVGIRLGVEDEIMISLQGDQGSVPDLSIEDIDVSVTHLSPYGTQVLAGSGYLLIEILNRRFRVSAGSFFQVNSSTTAALVDHVLENLDLRDSACVLDVYAGVGLFSAFIARRVGNVIAIESAESACQDYEINLDEFDNIELYQAPAEIVLNNLEVRPDCVILDPPRAGLDRKVVDNLVGMSPPVIVYVSCDPATMARDAQRLVKWGYQLDKITLLDMFPQTYHLESVGFWRRVQA
jgi:23S rRNA (uracil1939-C5)-methyltransferase